MFQKNVSEFSCVVSLKDLSWMSNLEHLSQSYLTFPFTLKFSLSSLHLYGQHKKREKKNTMWTFCLIKGLDTLSRSWRKAPFISSYWIFVCVVSVLFNFTLQFIFITGAAERVSWHLKQCHEEFKYLCLSIHRKVLHSLPSKCSRLFLHQRRHGRHPDLAHISCKNIPSLFSALAAGSGSIR